MHINPTADNIATMMETEWRLAHKGSIQWIDVYQRIDGMTSFLIFTTNRWQRLTPEFIDSMNDIKLLRSIALEHI